MKTFRTSQASATGTAPIWKLGTFPSFNASVQRATLSVLAKEVEIPLKLAHSHGGMRPAINVVGIFSGGAQAQGYGVDLPLS